VLADAQAAGYAEADPSADVDGHDAAAKTAILATLAFDVAVHADDVYREGIRGVSAADLRVAERLGYVIKLIGVANVVDGRVGVRVHPAMLPAHIRSRACAACSTPSTSRRTRPGRSCSTARAPGAMPTGAAVVGDLIDAARGLVHTTTRPSDVHSAGGPAHHRRAAHPVLRAARGRRPAGRARRGRALVRCARRVDRAGLAGRGRRRRRARARHPPLTRGGPARDGGALGVSRQVRRVAGVIRVESEAFVIDEAQPGRPVSGAASSSSTPTACRSVRTRRSSRCARAARRSSTRSTCRS
jgi:hypothetical protein